MGRCLEAVSVEIVEGVSGDVRFDHFIPGLHVSISFPLSKVLPLLD